MVRITVGKLNSSLMESANGDPIHKGRELSDIVRKVVGSDHQLDRNPVNTDHAKGDVGVVRKRVYTDGPQVIGPGRKLNQMDMVADG